MACHVSIPYHIMYAAGDGSFLQRFFSATADMDPAQRGTYLEHPPEGAPDIDEAHHVSHKRQLYLSLHSTLTFPSGQIEVQCACSNPLGSSEWH